jgi:hypothetical protein
MRTRTATIPSTGGRWELAENATMRLPRGRRGTCVRVERGTVLVTQQGDLEDHVLETGDEIVLPVRGLAVAWAFTDAAISAREAALPGSNRQPHVRPGVGSLAEGATR